MNDQTQTRLGMRNSILTQTRVRGLTPSDLGITAPEQSTDRSKNSIEGQDDIREAAVEAVKQVDGKSSIGAAVYTTDGNLYTGIPVEGNGWGTHAIELAVSKAISEGAVGITSVAVYSEDGQSGLCGRCLQALVETQDDEVTIEILSSEGLNKRFALDELTSWASHS